MLPCAGPWRWLLRWSWGPFSLPGVRSETGLWMGSAVVSLDASLRRALAVAVEVVVGPVLFAGGVRSETGLWLGSAVVSLDASLRRGLTVAAEVVVGPVLFAGCQE
ncbi:hypothetical protein NDU88_011615 [Pleurodeles waltl]|uniref:Secreted protein n=1 Tax=Pleurodeles waltl TaxID=8319 RepID=A0AAV7PZ91_PLEWA|nr:hypothetical protein NDU88_011615 [Pleurodeles waltl]